MGVWIVVGVWVFAIVFALVVLGFAGYELSWKTRRLQADQAKLQALVAELADVGARLQHAADRVR